MLKKLPSGHYKTKVDLKIHKNLRYVCIACRSVYKWFPGNGIRQDDCQCGVNVVLLPKADLILDGDGKCKQLRGQVIL